MPTAEDDYSQTQSPAILLTDNSTHTLNVPQLHPIISSQNVNGFCKMQNMQSQGLAHNTSGLQDANNFTMGVNMPSRNKLAAHFYTENIDGTAINTPQILTDQPYCQPPLTQLSASDGRMPTNDLL